MNLLIRFISPWVHDVSICIKAKVSFMRKEAEGKHQLTFLRKVSKPFDSLVRTLAHGPTTFVS